MGSPTPFGNVPLFTRVYYPSTDDDQLFSAPLAALCASLDLPPPRFRGRVEPTVPEGWQPRWEIEVKIRGRDIAPATQDITFIARYPTFEQGLQFAMQCAFAQVCRDYRHEFPEDSPFLLFGRRNHACSAVATTNDKGATPVKTHFENMEINTVDLESCLEHEMTRTDLAEEQIGNLLGEKTQWQEDKALLQNTAVNMEGVINQLLYERDQARFYREKFKTFLKATTPAEPADLREQACYYSERFKAFMVAAAAAEPAPAAAPALDQAPPPPQDQEVVPQEVVPTEEEEPQEVHEMDTPATNTRSKRKRVNGAATSATPP
ncbi:uncharacterized protein LOC112270001 [Brachypodium distachyon]|uniref:uncharacterized protein LOC112270001 n=1 Tax=Brachypodium distachyon TaxID=15368 RepID=UPI000D0CB845|nr:uncharacterized protein LOC112270001 [Brachypodium distachyon]|eukprot:XP_024313369.1 uncharacterized protein LOC112270001 [Brachypodium distachyon]